MELYKAVILFVGVVVAVCSGLPAQNLKDQVENVGTYGDQPIIDTGVFSGWDNPFSSDAFGGLFDSIESVMDRMRQQIASLLNRFPMRSYNSSDESGSFPGFINGADLPAFPGIGDIDLSKGNSSSVTKIIDGHTVVINETEYKDEDAHGGTFFKVRIIDFKPDVSGLTTEDEAEAVPSESREEIENTFENEILKSNELRYPSHTKSHANINSYDNSAKHDNEFSNIETFDDEVDLMRPIFTQNFRNIPGKFAEPHVSMKQNSEWFEDATLGSSEWHDISPVVPFDRNEIESVDNLKDRAEQPPPDLSSDTRVNDILAKNGAPTNPDAEVFFVAQEPGKFSRSLPAIDPR